LLLENYLLNYTKLSDNYRNSDVKTKTDKDNNSILFILMFSGILFMSIGCLISYIHQPVRLFFITLILISIAGINTGIMEKIKNKKNRLKTDCVKEIEKNKLQILRIYNKYNFAENAENDFTVQANCNIQKMNYNISEYKRLSYDLLKLSTELKTETENLIKSKELLNSTKDKLKNLIEEKESFLKKVSVEKLENYPEIYEFARELKNICVSISETEKSILDTDKMGVNFAGELNDFLQTCEIDETVNKYDNFEDILDKIRDSLDKSLENNRLKTELISKIDTYDNELVKYSDEIKAKIAKSGTINPEETELVLKTKQEEKGKLTRSKEILEQVSNLVELKNKRNVEINRLKSCLNRLIVKEVVLMIIEKSKEKFNETQPNLISAKKYLSKITNGKYNEINFEYKSISGVNMPEKDWDTLSRGTKEQLYLALRLGFADNYSKDIDGNFNGIPQLPLIIDDAFVNFDKSRTTAVLKCLEEFGKNNQVLYFTCHTEVIKDILKKANIKYNLIEL
ncbi:MAG: hypothetical protein LUB59_00890, partial [Candidatus Gastranaerophilales bacterium]|nr:hypothetical protein [Candidatus Gastranaerophilales bacterium]